MAFKFLIPFLAVSASACLLPQSKVTQEPVKPAKTPPMEYFAAHCQRCHGENGGNYVPQFAKGKTDEALTETLRSMAAGPGGESLEPKDLAIQLVFHHAISDSLPFIVWTAQKGNDVSGEFTPEAKLTAKNNDQPIEITTKEGGWTIHLTSPDVSKLVIEATLNKKVSILDLSKLNVSKPPDPDKL